MDRSKPSAARTDRQQSYTGLRRRLPTVAPAERWPVTSNWAEETAGTMADDKMHPNLNEQPEQTKPEREAQPAQQSPSDLGGSVGPARGVGTEASLPQLKEHAAEATMKPGIRRRAPGSPIKCRRRRATGRWSLTSSIAASMATTCRRSATGVGPCERDICVWIVG